MKHEHDWHTPSAQEPSFKAKYRTIEDFVRCNGVEATRNHPVAGPFLVDLVKKQGIVAEDLEVWQKAYVASQKMGVSAYDTLSDVVKEAYDAAATYPEKWPVISTERRARLRTAGQNAVLMTELHGHPYMGSKDYRNDVAEAFAREEVNGSKLHFARKKYEQRSQYRNEDEEH